jgi:phytanoyl-CoA hydroxylase
MSQPAEPLRTLWTDRTDAMQLLAQKSVGGLVTSAERDDVAHFIDHGWLLWRNAIDAELIEQFARDIRAHHKHPGCFVTTDHRANRSGLKLSGKVADRFESLFDLYVNFDSSRKVCMHPRIARFLTLVFEARPIAFQQLLFQRSNQHQVHQDTSVVAVEDPMLLVATWIALEDVVEGSGELGYYDRSHRLPHYLFKDGSKRMNFAADDQAQYARGLDEACRTRGMAYERLLARKGDVFLLDRRPCPLQLSANTARRDQPSFVRDTLLPVHHDAILVPPPSRQAADRGVRHGQRLRQHALQAAGGRQADRAKLADGAIAVSTKSCTPIPAAPTRGTGRSGKPLQVGIRRCAASVRRATALQDCSSRR